MDAVFTAALYELLPQAEINLTHAAKAANVKRIAKLSTILTSKDPTQAHQKAIDAIKTTGIEYTILKATFFMRLVRQGETEEVYPDLQ